MNKLLALVIFWLSLCEVYSQDLILMVKGDTLNVIITKVTPEVVEYNFQNKTTVNLVNKKNIHKIIFTSGRVEICNEKKILPIIKSKDEWEKVIISFDENDIIGLTECGTIIGKSGLGGIASVQGGENAIKEMQKKAAEKGAPIILISDGWDKEKNKPISGYGRGVKLTGKAYK